VCTVLLLSGVNPIAVKYIISYQLHAKLNPGLPLQKQHLTKRRLFTSKLYLNLGKKIVKCYIWSIALYAAEK